MNKNILIVGTGFLGKELVSGANSVCGKISCTHKSEKFFPYSQKFDFFEDDISRIISDDEAGIVILSAKIEFESNFELLEKSMIRFLEGCTGKRVIYISSDGIFDGETGVYKESDDPKPVTIYGKNLLLCESLVRKYSSDYLIIRPSYIFGRSFGKLDSRLGRVRESLEANNVVERFVDMYKSPMCVEQTARIILELALSKYIGIVHVAGERMSVYDFIKESMEALGVSVENLKGIPMLKEDRRPIDFLSDTSLDNGLMEKLTGKYPMSIIESLRNN